MIGGSIVVILAQTLAQSNLLSCKSVFKMYLLFFSLSAVHKDYTFSFIYFCGNTFAGKIADVLV